MIKKLKDALELMTRIQKMNTQELIRLRSTIDEELIDRKFDLLELKMNRRKSMIKFVHFLKFGVYR